MGVLVKQANIGVAPASYWLIGGSPRINSIVRSIPEVEYMVCSTCLRFVYGLMMSAGERCASTWSAPFWASSSRINTADSFQIELFDKCSTNRPTARSLSATWAVGVGAPILAPLVWLLPNRILLKCGTALRAMSESTSFFQISTRSMSFTRRL